MKQKLEKIFNSASLEYYTKKLSYRLSVVFFSQKLFEILHKSKYIRESVVNECRERYSKENRIRNIL